MLEGKELEGNIGNVGTYSVDVNDKGEVEVSVGVKVNVIDALKKLAEKSDNKIDDAAVNFIANLLK